MPYSVELDARIVRELESLGITRKKMFGGICYLWSGKMLCGVYKDFLIARVGEDEAVRALKKPHTKPFDITGKVMKGWVMVDETGVSGKKLGQWLSLSQKFVSGIP